MNGTSADVIKGLEKGRLGKIILDYQGGSKNHKGSYKEDGGGCMEKSQRRKYDESRKQECTMRKMPPAIAGFEDGAMVS